MGLGFEELRTLTLRCGLARPWTCLGYFFGTRVTCTLVPFRMFSASGPSDFSVSVFNSRFRDV